MSADTFCRRLTDVHGDGLAAPPYAAAVALESHWVPSPIPGDSFGAKSGKGLVMYIGGGLLVLILIVVVVVLLLRR